MMDTNNIYDMIIIGAGPAGLSAGIYGARAKFKTLVIEKEQIGGQITITAEVVNYPGVPHTTGKKLTEAMRKQAEYFGAEFISAQVEDVDFSQQVKIIKTSKGEFRTIGVIIATGSNPRKVGFPGEIEFQGRGIAYCATCDGEFFTGLDVFVVGAGFAAAEEAMFLTRFARKVTIIAREPEFTCAKTIADKVLAHDNIEVKFNTEIVEVGGDTSLKFARFINNQTKETWEYHVEDPKSTFGVFVFIGYAPNSKLFQGKIDLDAQGYIVTDISRKTSADGVYAAGDICIKNLRQVVTAVSDGAVASTSLEKYVEEVRQALGIKRTEDNFPVRKELTEEAEASEEFNNKKENGNFIDEDTIAKLRPVFDKLEKEVTLAAMIEDMEEKLSAEIVSFLKELEPLCPKIHIRIYKKGENSNLEDKVTLYPSILLLDYKNEYTGIQFHGVPGGHEFNSFIIAVYNAAGPGREVSEETLSRLVQINEKVNLKICVSLSCTMCPDVVMASQQLAVLNPYIEAEMIDLVHFPSIKTEYSIMSVPCLIKNNTEVLFGKKNMEEILEFVLN